MPEKLFPEFPPASKKSWQKCLKQIGQTERTEQTEQDNSGESLISHSKNDLNIFPYYCQEDLKNIPHVSSTCSLMSRPLELKSWEIRQEVHEADYAKANAEGRFLLEAGADGAAFAVHSGTITRKEKKKNSCALSCSEDLEKLFSGIDLKKKKVHFLCGLDSLDFLGSLDVFPIIHLLPKYLAVSDLSPQKFFSCIDCDLFSYWLLKKGLSTSSEDAFSKIASTLQFCTAEIPKVRWLCVSGQAYHSCGADPLEEAGFVLAAAHELIAPLQKKIHINALLQSLWFSLGISSDYFLEIARLRALRLVFLRLVQEYDSSFQKDSSSFRMYIHGQSLPINKTFVDEHTNILRSSTECTAAVLGSVDSFTCSYFNAATANSSTTRLAKRLAVHTQLIQRHEAHIGRVFDPAAGSYYIEKLTDICAKKIWSYFQKIEKGGGLISMLKKRPLSKRNSPKKK